MLTEPVSLTDDIRVDSGGICSGNFALLLEYPWSREWSDVVPPMSDINRPMVSDLIKFICLKCGSRSTVFARCSKSFVRDFTSGYI